MRAPSAEPSQRRQAAAHASVGSDLLRLLRPYSLRGPQRYACSNSNHISNATYDNSRSIRQDELESRGLAGLKNRMMAPEILEKAMHAYAQGNHPAQTVAAIQ